MKILKLALPLGFAVISIILLWFAGVNPYDLLMCMWWPLLTVLQFSIVLFYFTSLPYKHLLTALGLGASVVPLVTFLIQKPLNLLLEGSQFQYALSQLEALGTTYLQTPVIAPVTEELTKLLPVFFILLLLLRYKKYRLLSPVDFALLGLAAGAGFDIFENICRAMNGYYDVLGLYRSEINEPIPDLFGIFLFPSMIRSEYMGNPMIWFGHGGLAGCISLAVGFVIYLKKKRYIFIPIVTYIICTFDHSMWNWYQPYPEQLWAKILPKLTLYGRLVPILMAAGLLAAVCLVLRNKKRFKAELRKTALPKDSSAPLLNKIADAITRLRRQNQLANAFRHYLIKGIKSEPFDVIVSELANLKPAEQRSST